MPRYEYTVVPAPKKPGKIKGVKGTDNRFAAELSRLMNDYGADGWEYQRTDTLPCEERQGLTGRTTTFQTMLVFRREIKDLTTEPLPEVPLVEAEPTLAVPSFGATAPAPAIAAAAPEGEAPALGPAEPPTPDGTTRAPDIAAQ
ncbi:MAG: DUF4177 domain-containing protein [Rhodobacter sp.]|nr:DUF4177 domain-containing protein [Rhodobacter sp.]